MPLRLHVVYAGRGDAFVVESDTELWVIDGGPLGRTPQSQGGAPYYRHLEQVIGGVAKRLGQQEGTAAPSGIVVSHAHEDHYGGILRLFRDFLSPTYATTPALPQHRLVFNGPLVTQPLTNLKQDGQQQLLAGLRDFEFAEKDPPEPVVPGPFQFGDPNSFPRVVYERTPTPPPPQMGRVWTVDESPDNLASVLMFHPAGRMLFTGDSTGAKILPFITQQAQGDPLNVFKVPHHGSLRNSQRTGNRAIVPADVWHEYALLCVLADPTTWDTWGVPQPLRDSPGSMASAQTQLQALCRELGINPVALKGELETVVKENFDAAATGAPVGWKTAQRASKTTQLWRKLKAKLESMSLMSVRTAGDESQPPTKRRRALLPPVDRSWYSALLTPSLLTEPYLSRLAYTELKTFYSAFNAYNYVISADGSHGHPAAETIAAIIESRKQKNLTARVFVTDASSVDLERIEQLAGANWDRTIDLRALSSLSAEMVLDLTNPDNAKTPPYPLPPPNQPIAIDPNGTTTSVAAIAQPDREALHAAFQTPPGSSIAPRRPNLDEYLLKLVGASPSLYLEIDANGNPSVTSDETAFFVEEAWLVQPPQPEFSIGRLQRAKSPNHFRLVNLIDRGGGGWALQLYPGTDYVSKSAASNYRTLSLADPELAVFEFSEVTEAAASGRSLTAAETEPTLRAFLRAAGLPSDGPLTGEAALTALVGPRAAAAAAAKINLRVLRRLLGWEADLDSSTVTWSSDSEGFLVTEATLAIAVGSPATFQIEGITETIASCSITLTRGEELKVTAALRTEDETDLDDTATVASPGRGRPLAEYLSAVGVAGAEQAEVTVAGLLSRMLGSQSRVEDLLMNGPSFVAAAGIGTTTLDLEASEVETFTAPTGGIDVRAATLVTRQPSISPQAAGISLTLEGATLTVEDALLPSAQVVLGAAAKITPAGSSQPVPLRAEIALTEERPELSLALVDGGALGDVVSLLPGTPALGNLEVPVAAQTLGSLSLSSLGLGLRQPVEDADAYVVSSVFAAIEFSAWDRILPAGFPTPSSAAVEVRVYEPEDATGRRIGFEAEASFPLASGGALSAMVAAWPMSGSGEAPTTLDGGTAKSVALWADPRKTAVTLAELSRLFGLPAVGGALPALGSLLESIALRDAEIELKDADGGGTEVSAFELGLWINEPWTPLAGFSLTSGQLELRYDGAEWGGMVTASMLLGSSQAVEVGYVVPTATAPGAFTFSPVGALSLADAASLIGLGSLTGVPLLGTLLETVAVDEASLVLAPTSTTATTISAWSLGLLLDTIQLGPLTVDGVAINLARTGLGGESSEAQTSLWLEAELGGSAIVTVEWDSAAGKLAGALRMLETQTLEEMLASLLGSGAPANVLLPIVGQFAVIGAEVEFDTSGERLTAFQLDLDTSKSLTLGPATVSTLSIVYAAGASEGEPSRYALSGKLTGSQATAEIEIDCLAGSESSTVTASVKSAGTGSEALTLRGLISIFSFGTLTVPTLEGAPDFLSLEVTEVAAKLTYAGGLGLESLTAKVHSTKAIPLVPTTPPIEVEELGLDVSYEKGGSPSLTGSIFGTLTIPTTPQVIVHLKYTLGKDQVGVFEGTATLTDPPDYKALLSQGPYDPGPGGGVPTDLGLPQSIPLAELTVKVEMAKATTVTVSGYAQPTDWTWTSLGIDFAVSELGGRVTVIKDPGEPVQYDCALIGALSFDGFLGRAAVAFGDKRNTVLTASATQGKAVQLPEIAGKLGSSPDTWKERVPTGTAPLEFGAGSAAYAYLDLSARAFVLFGSLAGFGTGALLSHTAGGKRSYAFLAGLSSSFRFKNLWAAMATIDDYVVVRKANLAILDYAGEVEDLKKDIAAAEQAAKAMGVSLEDPFAGLDWLGKPGASPSLHEGAAFFADLALSPDGTLSRNLELISAEPAAAAAIALYALVDHAEPQNTLYEGEISDLKLLGGGLTLSGAVKYQPAAEANWLEVSGSMLLVLATGEDGYEFKGALTLGTEKATFKAVTGGTPISIVDPFGGMFGITIVKAQLAAEFDFGASGTTSTIVVSGEASLKVGASLPPMTAAIAFAGGKPVLASVFLPSAISVDKLLEAIGVPWPSGYEVLTFENGRIYYAREEVEIGGVKYEPGYHMATTAKVFKKPIAIDVAVDSEGIVVTVEVVEGFDFYFLQLTGYTEHEHTYKGPFVSIDARKSPSFTVGSGISLFGTAIGSTTIQYQTSIKEWTGSVTVVDSVPVIGGQAIGFAYSEKEGFRIANLELISELLEWAELADQLIEASKGTRCGELVGLAWDSVVKTKANVTVTQSEEATVDELKLDIGGTFDILVADRVVVTVPLPTLVGVVHKPEKFELAALPGWLLTLLEDNLVSMAESLFKDKTKLAEFIGALAGVTASREGLAALICNDVKTDNVKADVEDSVDTGVEDAGDWAADITVMAADAAAAGSLASLGTAVGKATLIFVGLAALVEQLVYLIEKALSWIPGLESKKEKAEEEKRVAETKRNEAKARMEKALTMAGAPTAAFEEGSATRVQVFWTKADRPAMSGFNYEGYADVKYRVQVSTTSTFEDGTTSAVVKGQGSPLTAELSALASVNYAYVRIRAVYGCFVSNPLEPAPFPRWLEWEGPWEETGQKAFHLVPLAPPATVSQVLADEGDTLAVTVAPVTEATGYRVTLVDAANPSVVLLRQQAPAPASGPAVASLDVRDLPNTVPTGASLVAEAVAEGDPALHTNSAPTRSAPVATSAPPSAPTVAIESDGLHVTWAPVQGASGYEVRAVSPGGAPLSPQPAVLSWDPGGDGCLLSGEKLTDGEVVGIELRVRDASHVALWSSPATSVTVPVLAAPAGFDAVFECEESVLALSWGGDTRASSWGVECTTAAGEPLSPPPSIVVNSTGTGATVSGSAIALGGSYKVRARPLATGAVSQWSEWQTVMAATVAAPTGIVLSFSEDSIIASWQGVESASVYRVTLLSLPAAAVVAEEAPTAPTATFKPSPLGPEKEWEVAVRAQVETSVGPAAKAHAVSPSLLASVEAFHGHGESAEAAATGALAYQAGLGYAELLATLAAAGYSATEAEAATKKNFPTVDLGPLVAALPSPALLAPLLSKADLAVAVIVRLTAKLYAGKPVELAIQLRAGGLLQADVAAALPGAYASLTPEAATAIATAVYLEPWALGGQLAAGEVAESAVVPDFFDAYPLPILRAMASFHAHYSVADRSKPIAPALIAKEPEAWGVDLGALLDESGVHLAQLLNQEGVSRAEATSYVTAAFPKLSPKDVEEAIESAYGPS